MEEGRRQGELHKKKKKKNTPSLCKVTTTRKEIGKTSLTIIVREISRVGHPTIL